MAQKRPDRIGGGGKKMKALTLSANTIYCRPERLQRSRQRWNYVLAVSAAAAAGLMIGALLANGISLASGAASMIGYLGVMLTIGGFLMLVLTAHALDKVREADRSIREGRIQRSMRPRSGHISTTA